MTNANCRYALAAVLAVGPLAWAVDDPKSPADAPKPAADAPKDAPKPPASGVLNPNAGKPEIHSAGQLVARLGKAGDGSVTVKVPQLERHSTGRRASARTVEKDHEIDFADDVKIRWKSLPKKADGSSYSNQEMKTLRESADNLGYKAEKSDLKPGQTVKLYLGKAGKDDKPVVTTVVIVADAPKHDDKAEKKK
jgi:hypothetical protein